MEKKRREVFNLLAYNFLLIMTLSFLGWAFEVGYVYLKTGRYWDAGFMTLPFCPIYGCSLFIIFLLCGTPKVGRGVLKEVKSPFWKNTIYLLFAFLIPTLAELIIGAFFDKAFHLKLWSYANRPLNYKGYICLPVSVAWAALTYWTMRFIFPSVQKWIFRIPPRLANGFATLLAFLTLIDVVVNILLLP